MVAWWGRSVRQVAHLYHGTRNVTKAFRGKWAKEVRALAVGESPADKAERRLCGGDFLSYSMVFQRAYQAVFAASKDLRDRFPPVLFTELLAKSSYGRIGNIMALLMVDGMLPAVIYYLKLFLAQVLALEVKALQTNKHKYCGVLASKTPATLVLDGLPGWLLREKAAEGSLLHVPTLHAELTEECLRFLSTPSSLFPNNMTATASPGTHENAMFKAFVIEQRDKRTPVPGMKKGTWPTLPYETCTSGGEFDEDLHVVARYPQYAGLLEEEAAKYEDMQGTFMQEYAAHFLKRSKVLDKYLAKTKDKSSVSKPKDKEEREPKAALARKRNSYKKPRARAVPSPAMTRLNAAYDQSRLDAGRREGLHERHEERMASTGHKVFEVVHAVVEEVPVTAFDSPLSFLVALLLGRVEELEVARRAYHAAGKPLYTGSAER